MPTTRDILTAVFDPDTNKLATTASASVSTSPGASNLATNQVSVTDSATAIVAARAARRSVLIFNHGTTDVYIGGAAVTTSTGILLVGTAGAAVSIPTAAAVYGIVASGSQTVSYIEVYD